MKVRHGFVSNSSSSSFLLYGVCVDREAVLAGYNRLVKAGEIKGRQTEDIWDIDGAMGLEFHIPWDDEVYVGLSWDDVGNDETGREFKARAVAAVLAIIPKYKGDFSTHKEAWRDG
jgi:hypothetical protein